MIDVLTFCYDIVECFIVRGGLNLFLPIVYLFACVFAFNLFLRLLGGKYV